MRMPQILRRLLRPTDLIEYNTPLTECEVFFIVNAAKVLHAQNQLQGVNWVYLNAGLDAIENQFPFDLDCDEHTCINVNLVFMGCELEAFRKLLLNYQVYLEQFLYGENEPLVLVVLSTAERARVLSKKLQPSFLQGGSNV